MKLTLKQARILAVSAVCAICATCPSSPIWAMPLPQTASQTQTRAQVSTTAAAADTQADAVAGKSYELDVDGSKQWVDTNIDLRMGEKIHIAGSGTITYPAADTSKPAQSFNPDGLARGWKDLIHQYAVTDGGHGALIGRLGAADAGGQPFLVGSAKDYQAPVAGRLFLGINQSYKDSQAAQGSFHVTIERDRSRIEHAGGDAVAGGPPKRRLQASRPRFSRKFRGASAIRRAIPATW